MAPPSRALLVVPSTQDFRDPGDITCLIEDQDLVPLV
jgi:hypothetical protein